MPGYWDLPYFLGEGGGGGAVIADGTVSDREVYAAIKALIVNTGRFDAVEVTGRERERLDFPSNRKRTVHIRRMGDRRSRVDGSPHRRLNEAEYRLYLEVRERDERKAGELVDRLGNRLRNLLLHPSNKQYTSYVIKRFVDLVPVGEPVFNDVGARWEFEGQFAYALNMNDGFET